MPEDASLDDFLGGGGEADDDAVESDDDADAGEPDQTESDEAESVGIDADGEGRVQPTAVEGATTTAAWSPEGAVCAACGETAAYRWQGEAGLVCPDCKEW